MPIKRKSLSNKSRFEVFKRDSFTCQYCGAVPPKAILHVDHIHPVKHGGDNSEDNLITSCNICNSGKAATLLTDAPKSLKDKAKAVAEAERQIKGYSDVMRQKTERLTCDTWAVAKVLNNAYKTEMPKPKFITIKKFIEKLGLEEVYEAAEIAALKQIHNKESEFKYFCGVCHNKAKGE